MVWEKIGKDHACGPWLIRRFGFKFALLRNGREIGKFKTIAEAKLAAEAYLDGGS